MANFLISWWSRGKEIISRVAEPFIEAKKGFLAGWSGVPLEKTMASRLPSLTPEQRQRFVRQAVEKGQVETPVGPVTVTPADIAATAAAKVPEEVLKESIIKKTTILDKVNIWGIPEHYKVHYEHIISFIDERGISQRAIVDDWITITSDVELSEKEIIARAMEAYRLAKVGDVMFYAEGRFAGVKEVHHYRYKPEKPTGVGGFLEGLLGQ
jgi:hypothetical protein